MSHGHERRRLDAVAPFDDDRSMSEDLEAVTALVTSDRLDTVIV